MFSDCTAPSYPELYATEDMDKTQNKLYRWGPCRLVPVHSAKYLAKTSRKLASTLNERAKS
jgi:hypothetical protein